MSALHWICALTLALVCCLSAQPVKRNAEVKRELLQDLNHLKNIAKNCQTDTKLYSPFDIREDCLPSALNCTIEEINVLANECKTEVDKEDFEVFDNLMTGLSRGLKVSPSSSPNCICEKLYNQTDVKQFLNNIENLVQRL